MSAAEKILPENQVSHNKVSLSFSQSLLKQIQLLAETDGVCVEDLLLDFVNQSLKTRAFQVPDNTLPMHLMTRNGDISERTPKVSQPKMTYHTWR